MTNEEQQRQDRILIESRSRGTLGHKEASDKESFMTGVSVACSLLFEMYEDKETRYKAHIAALEATVSNYQSELQTISRIISRYAPE